jgi:short-subunit dehydrogenase
MDVPIPVAHYKGVSNLMSKQNKGVALVTGASAGIGAVYADRLAKRGYDLILTARRGDRLKALADKLGAASGQKIETVVADLSKRADFVLLVNLDRKKPRYPTRQDTVWHFH